MFSRCGSICSFISFLLLTAALTFAGEKIHAQTFGNEWINYDQRYYRFPVHEEGVYRISYNTLVASGVPVNSIDPRNFQIFNREQEVPIYVEGEGDGVFNLNDFIELYATGNDGWLDALVYDNPSNQTNPFYSLYNDTIYYYLTWNQSINNQRVQPEVNQNVEGLTPLSYVWKTNKINITSDYRYGELDQWGGSSPFYTIGEGWFGPLIGFPFAQNPLTTPIPSSNAYSATGAPQAIFRAISASSSNATGTPNHHLRIEFGSNNTVVYDQTFSGYQLIDHTFTANPNQLGAATTNVVHRIVNDLGVASDYVSVAHVSLKYPHIPNFTGVDKLMVGVPSNGTGSPALFQFQGFTPSSIVYSLGNSPKRIVPQQQGASLQVAINQSGAEVPCFIVANTAIQNVPAIQAVGTGGFFTNFELFNPDSAYIIVSHPLLWQGAQAYESHRSLQFNTLLVNVNELYDQFGGGINKHGISIRRFINLTLNNWDTPPQHLFLLGKSIREAKEGNAPGSRQNTTYFAGNLVPSFGYPSSDNLITVGLTSNNFAPAVNTGRISAKNNDEVFDYLNKVITYESQAPAMWMKNVLHFGGGTNPVEQNQFRNYLEGYANTISDTCFGGIVTPFYKVDSNPISITESAELTELIEGGVTIMTFFGHAGGSGFDQNIDNPSNFNWDGKYPFLIGNACYTGDIHQPSAVSTSEQFTLIQDKGVIGFLSTVKLGFAGELNVYTSQLYKQIAYLNYGKSVGKQISATVAAQGFPLANQMKNQVLGMTLHGDPAVVLNSFKLPDYAVDVSSVFFDPPVVTTVIDSFDVHISLLNLGKATNQSFDVIVERKFPDNGADSVYVIHVDRLLNADTVSITLPVQPGRALGINSFNISVDLPMNVVDELDDFGNNTVNNVQLPITNGGIIPVYPYRFAVVDHNQVTLKASTGDPNASITSYRFQLDTNSVFMNPIGEIVVQQAGGLVEWQLPFTCSDSTVYFWRVCIDTIPSERRWQNTSFQYIEGKTGWGQAHFHQFKDNQHNSVEYIFEDRKFDFFSGEVNLRCQVYGNSLSLATLFTLNVDQIEYGGCGQFSAIHVAVIHPSTFEAWGTSWQDENPGNNFGNYNNGNTCRNRVEYTFFYYQQEVWTEAMYNQLILDAVPDGHYVLIYSWKYLEKFYLESQNNSFFSAVNYLGGTLNFDSMNDSIPYVLLARKGDPTFVHEIIGVDKNDLLELNINLPATGREGTMASAIAGPAAEWQSMHWRFKSLENPNFDSTQVALRGRLWNGSNIDLPQTSYNQNSIDFTDLNNTVNASQTPFLRFNAFLKDSVDQTPAQLRRWHLLFDEIPEAVVNPVAAFSFDSPTLNQGETIHLKYAITNASTRDMDSLLVKSWVTNSQNVVHNTTYRRIAPLPAAATIIDSLSFDTWGFAGINQLWVEVNPSNPNNPQVGQYDQLEQYHFNNFLQLPFDVDSDNINPLLDVTFDGLHILDGEVVSAQPEISISLTDENLFLMLNSDADTSNFEIFVAYPGGEFNRTYFFQGGVENMRWIPASGNTNKFQILYNPRFTQDGTHKLLVRGKDRSGNTSGDKDYQISFEVINQSTITDVLNYPNPFSTKTHFVFTLTGSEVPDYMKIQIMTVSGKIVREITHFELGPIRVGRNITDYYWDGTDMYGDRLANGVYLYRVIAKINGQNIDKRETAAGKYFKQEFGKMYLMR
jgi:hypothetical protein